ncbi:MAG: hypothetical protein MR748_10495, partial [Clostridiales bacterium]|nr:hypothetical protein [Clostridiales bacterium]
MSRAVPSQRLRQETLRNWQIKAISHVTYKQTMLKMLHEGFSKVRHTKAAHCSAIETDGSEALYRLSLPLFDKEPFLHQKTRKTYVLRAACQKRSRIAAFFDIIGAGDEDAEERARTAAGNRDAVCGYAGAEGSS